MDGHRIRDIRLHPIRIPYPRAMQWASISEDAASYMLLEIETDSGLTGVAEGTVKTTWTSNTHRSLQTIFEEIFFPILKGAEIEDDRALARVAGFKEHSLAKAMIDVAIWDLRSQAAGQPLWQLWGGTSSVPVSWVVTRQPPAEMAREAEDIVARYGIKTLKVKGGQGFEMDAAALREIRKAVGERVRIYVDPNKEYAAQETPDYCKMLADFDVLMVEDPCTLYPNEAFAHLQSDCCLPLLVDNTCRSLRDAELFVERGAKAFNLKLQKARGYTENRQIVEHAMRHGCDVNVGLYGESSLGSLAALQLAAALPAGGTNLPAEVTMFLMLPDEYATPLSVIDGRIDLPEEAGMGRIINWEKVARLHA